MTDEEGPGGAWLIVAGGAALLATDGLRSRELARFSAGDIVGEDTFSGGAPASLVAIEPLQAWRLDAQACAALAEGHPVVWEALSPHLPRAARPHLGRRAAAGARRSVLLFLCDPERAAGLALLLSESVARQARRSVLLVDARAAGPPLAGTPGLRPLPVLCEIAADPSLASTHDRDPSPPWSAAVSALEGATPDAATAALSTLGRGFDDILVALDLAGLDRWPQLLDGAATVLLVAEEAEAPRLASLIGSLSAYADGARLEAVLLMRTRPYTENGFGGVWDGAAGDPASLQIEAAIGRRLRRLPEDAGLLRRSYTEGEPLPLREASSHLAQAIDRLARRLAALEVGVALGAGMAKGFAHIGVLRAFEEAGVPIDYLAGASVGSIVGSVYAGGLHLSRLMELMTGADRRFLRWTIPLRSLSSDAGLKQLLLTCHQRAPGAHFHHLFVPFAAVATDLGSGRDVVLAEGPVWRAVQASVSFPGIFPPTVIAGRALVDGGLVSPLPIEAVRAMGADIVVAVDLSAGARNGNEGPGWGRRRSPFKGPFIVDIVLRSMDIMLAELTARKAATADIVIRPRLARSGWRDFSRRGPSFVAAGEEAARAALRRLADRLPALRPAEALEVVP